MKRVATFSSIVAVAPFVWAEVVWPIWVDASDISSVTNTFDMKEFLRYPIVVEETHKGKYIGSRDPSTMEVLQVALPGRIHRAAGCIEALLEPRIPVSTQQIIDLLYGTSRRHL